MNHQYLLKHPELFQYVIGITHEQFANLLPLFMIILNKEGVNRAWSKQRIRIPGGGRKPTLKTTEEKLFFILFYYKTYPTFRFAQAIFGLDKRNVQLWMRYLQGILFETLGYELELPKRRVRHMDDWLTICPQLLEFLVDATERPINRPSDNHVQEEYYSGKKKQHTVKNQVFVSPRTKRILAVSDTVEGKRHDKKLFDDDLTSMFLPPGAVGMADKGYEGVYHPFVNMIIPKKKPPGREFTTLEKANNRTISSIRVSVEHPFSYMKHFNILSHKFRSRIKEADLPFKTIAAIYNFTRVPT